MSAFLNASIPPVVTQDLLLQQLLRVETMLLDSRARFMENFEREISLIRGWQSALHQSSSSPAARPEAQKAKRRPSPSSAPLQSPAPSSKDANSWLDSAADNIVHLTAADFTAPGVALHEAEPDPFLAQATVDELNTALVEAFKMMSANFDGPSLSEPPESGI